MPLFTLGADPELFVQRRGRNISAHGLIPGTKDTPHKMKTGMCQLDGTAVEFNIPPARNALSFVASVAETKKEVENLLPNNARLLARPTMRYGKKYFETIPEESKILGCDPDRNAYKNGELNPVPKALGTMRTGAGHLHLGFLSKKVDDPTSASHLADCCLVIQELDGIYQAIKHFWDTDSKRDQMYGAPGAFRPKPYGVEYRSPSNAWVGNPVVTKFLFNLCKRVVSTIEFHTNHGFSDVCRSFKPGTLTPETYNALCGMSNDQLPTFPRL